MSNTVEGVTMFLAVASLLAGISGLVFIASWFSPSLSAMVKTNLVGQERWIAFFCAGSAMTGSLYLSEIANFTPCDNCWYQRIAMYPIAVIMLIAAIRKDDNVWFYIPFLAVPGLLVSWYHLILQKTDIFGSGSCDPSAPCSQQWINHFGFVTIPFMAMGCFIFLIGLSVMMIRRAAEGEGNG